MVGIFLIAAFCNWICFPNVICSLEEKILLNNGMMPFCLDLSDFQSLDTIDVPLLLTKHMIKLPGISDDNHEDSFCKHELKLLELNHAPCDR